MGGESGDKLNVHFNDNPGSTLKCAAAAEMMQLACSGVWLTGSFQGFPPQCSFRAVAPFPPLQLQLFLCFRILPAFSGKGDIKTVVNFEVTSVIYRKQVLVGDAPSQHTQTCVH